MSRPSQIVEDRLERERDQHAKNLQMAAGDLGRWKFFDAVLSAELHLYLQFYYVSVAVTLFMVRIIFEVLP